MCDSHVQGQLLSSAVEEVEEVEDFSDSGVEVGEEEPDFGFSHTTGEAMLLRKSV